MKCQQTLAPGILTASGKIKEYQYSIRNAQRVRNQGEIDIIPITPTMTNVVGALNGTLKLVISKASHEHEEPYAPYRQHADVQASYDL